MIGSRGTDKVVQVPVGTVIHVVEGELPSAVQKTSSTTLAPWDIPGTLSAPVSSQSLPPYAKAETAFNVSPTPDPPLSTGLEDESNGAEYNVVELTVPGQQIIVAEGGEGGLGNLSTGKTSKTVAEEGGVEAETASSSTGFPGSEVVLVLELKSIADVGLVGMPNAGKSTLLGALSKAKPAVGHYAFTTLRPNLGNVNFDDFSVTVADIPGLVSGAHENRGLGHAFLRHVERTKVLAYVVDLAAGTGGNKGVPPWEQLRDLVLELEHYRPGLSDRPSLVVANKIDEDGAEEVCEELKQRVSGVPIFPVCAVLEEGTSELKDGLRLLVNGIESYRLNLEHIVLD
ncbi:unnamed protein product [Cuscuta campestris]|uniref:OBG-type G domain-containing protein n=1 Tax=Cuscuta campestris TaxID=132261 RepID=A0A484LK24_9ASTE|nr:unnamed protein product [Cuscuta campestris]